MREIREIAYEIQTKWPKVNFAARPYLDAMKQLRDKGDCYGLDSAKSVVLYFLCNAQSFNKRVSTDAPKLKAELKAIIGVK